jgi:hypothetical protein
VTVWHSVSMISQWVNLRSSIGNKINKKKRVLLWKRSVDFITSCYNFSNKLVANTNSDDLKMWIWIISVYRRTKYSIISSWFCKRSVINISFYVNRFYWFKLMYIYIYFFSSLSFITKSQEKYFFLYHYNGFFSAQPAYGRKISVLPGFVVCLMHCTTAKEAEKCIMKKRKKFHT